MEKFFSISKTAETAGMTAETLRYYDRIGLVTPSKTDKNTGYRYYSQAEIVRLNTIKALRSMDLSLSEIRNILEYDDLKKIAEALKQTEAKADKKIAELRDAKNKIRRARNFYESKLYGNAFSDNIFLKEFPRRVILLSDKLSAPTVDNLWNYHRHFYGRLPQEIRDEFAFDDLAGIYECGGTARMFALCNSFVQTDGIRILPQGKYLCADCTEENREEILRLLTTKAKHEYGASPRFSVQIIVLSGILQWNYQAQVPVEKI